MGLVVDTSAVVDLERDERSFGDALSELGHETVGLPAIVLAELLVGVELATSPQVAAARRGRVEAVRARVPVIDFTTSAAERWAQIRVALIRSGTPIPSNDVIVAATALALGWDVLVGRRDEAHFQRVPSLGVRVLTS